jgi:MFS family permease
MTDSAETPASAWLPALTAILAVQTTVSFLTRLIPTLAPVITRDLQISDAAIGYLTALNTAGSIAFLVVGGPLIRRFGPLRTLQFGLALGAVGVFLMAGPATAALGLASLMIGFAYAPSAPAGNEVLHRSAPPAHRSLIFSIKQAGVPMGGVLAGLTLPELSRTFGWGAALSFSLVVIVATIAFVQPMRSTTDIFRDESVAISPRSLMHISNLTEPLAVLFREADLFRLALVGSFFAIGQGAWLTFLVTMGVSHLGLDFAAAGVLFAVMQATGVVGRMLLGWIADRLGSGQRTLQIVAVTSALSSLALALATPEWGFAALCVLAAIAGVTVSSWNGVQLAEIARLAPKGRVAEASAGATIIIFIGYIIGPVIFSVVLTAIGRYDVALVVIAIITLAALGWLTQRPTR